ncbi:MAG: ATP-binding cassette domain-containing protein [Defluviitaleaceae bacterium]|nr:ATP-binding cassette domain-containing protein [Defluviitaleaceae bacterium]
MENIISVKSLEKSFKKHQVLKGVSFEIKKGSIFALLGSNGAGKTTAVRILSTLSKPDGGKATICGHDVVRHPHQVRECISLTGQYAAVDEVLTGRENLKLIASLKHLPNATQKADEMLKAFRLEDAANKQASTYSGGMRRRLDIAMSLMGNPQIIFLDEPTTGLDPQNRIAMWDMVKELAENGTTVFLTTQYLEEAEYLADHIAILHEGKITAEGTPDDLKTLLPRGGVQLTFNRTAEAKAAAELLNEYPVTFDQENPKTIDVTTDGCAAQFANVLTILTNANINISQFTQKQPTLEDVFLTIIGEKEAQ